MSSDNVFFETTDLFEVDGAQVARLKEIARHSPLRRARICLHRDHEDRVQQMLIVFHHEMYIPPHRQPRRFKSYQVLEGTLCVAFFDAKGGLSRRIVLEPAGGAATFLVRFSADEWHMVVPLSEFVVFLETAAGPFVRELTEYATWAPNWNDHAAMDRFIAEVVPPGLRRPYRETQ